MGYGTASGFVHIGQGYGSHFTAGMPNILLVKKAFQLVGPELPPHTALASYKELAMYQLHIKMD